MCNSFKHIFRLILVFTVALLAIVFPINSQGFFNADGNPIKIPVDLSDEDLKPGSKIVVGMSMPVACTGGGNQSVGGFMQCATQADAVTGIDRNDWWNCCAPPTWLPSEAYAYNFPPVESIYPCVAGTPVDELILTITINSVAFDLSSPYACCEMYLEGLFANLYDNCPVSGPCGVVGDGLVNNGNPGTGDCSPNGDHLVYDGSSSSFPLGIPFTSTTTCLNTIIGTGDELGVDIIPSFRYDEAAANGCNCTQDLISQGLISVDYSIEVEYVFCSNNLPTGCYPSTFTQVDPLCENDPILTLPTTSDNGYSGSWNPPTIDPSGQGGNTITAVFTPDPGQCVGGTSEMDIEINEATVPTFTQLGPVCENAAPLPLPSTSTNGVSGTWDVGATFDPSGQGGTTVTILFTPDAGLCAATETMDIVVNAESVPSFTQIGPLCESDPPVNLPSNSNNGVSGSWDVGASFDPAGQGGNNVVINFTPDPGQCASAQSMTITVNTEVLPTFNQIGPLCENDPPVTLPNSSGNGVNGSWDVGPTFDPAGQGGMTVTINFSPDPGECALPQTMDITVNNLTTPTFNQIGPLCESDPPFPLPTTSVNGITGSWDVGLSFDPAGQGGMTVTINFSPDPGQCADVQTMNIVVESELSPIFTPIGPLCESGAPVALPTVSNNGVNGTWDVGPTFDPQGLGGSVTTITFTPLSGECAISATMNITVLDEEAPVFTPIGPLCENDPPVPLPNISFNGYTGTWDVGSTFDPQGAGGSVVTINFTPDAGQCATAEAMQVTVLNEIVPLFDPIGPLCESDPPVVLPTTSLNGVTGSWDIGGVFDPSGQNGAIPITFIPDAGQCAAQATLTVTVNAEVQPTFGPIGPFCENDDPFTLPTTSIEGIPGSWDVGAEFDPDGLSGLVNITFTPDANQCAAQAVVGVQVNDIPTFNIIEVTCNSGFVDYFIYLQTDADAVSATSGTVTNNGNGSFTVDGIPEGTNTTITFTHTSSGCESTVLITSPNCNCPNIAPPTGLNVEICEGDTIPPLMVTVDAGLQADWYDAANGGTLLLANSLSYTPTVAGTYFAEAIDPNTGCSSNTRLGLELTILPVDTTFLAATTCDANQVGMDTVVYSTMVCDSIVITTYTLDPGDETFINDSSCDPNEVGIDTLYLTNLEGCDSLVITNTILSPADTTLANATSCDPSMVGVDTVVYSTAICDSVVITTTTLLESDEIFLFENTCDSNLVGLDTIILSNQNGCDSTVITEYSLITIPVTYLQATSCDPNEVGQDTTIFNITACDSVVITSTSLLMGDETFLTATSCDTNDIGIDTLVLNNVLGCDSLIITTTTLSAADTTFAQTTTCDANAVGIDTLVFSTATCDSIVILTSVLMEGDETFLNDTSCNPNDVGVDTIFLVNQMGCDSLIITTTQLLPPDTTFASATTCDINAAGIDTLIFSSSGCDSIVIVDFVFVPSNETLINLTSCDPNQVGVDTTFFTNTGGCDSLIIVNTVLELPDTTFTTATTCDINEVGMDTIIFTTADCDSIVIIDISLVQSDETFLNETSCDPGQVGIDTIFYTNAGGCDSLVITTTILAETPETIITQTSCIQAEVGQDTSYLLSQFGCDSLVITITTLQGGIVSAEINIDQPDCIEPFGSISIESVDGGTLPLLYSVDGGATFSTEPNFSDLSAGSYDVLIEDANGCNYSSNEILDNVTVPQAFFNPDQIELDLGDSHTLNPIFTIPDSQITSIEWTPDNDLSCVDCISPVANPVVTTEYMLTITDSNGCTASAMVLLIVNDMAQVYFPNAISPNGDGINDTFTLYAEDNFIEAVSSLKVFDRWGDNVFEQYDFPPNIPSVGWDGTKNGKQVEQGVHVFVAEVKLIDGRTLQLEGEITVIR